MTQNPQDCRKQRFYRRRPLPGAVRSGLPDGLQCRRIFVGDFELLIADICKQDKVVQGQEREQEDCPAFQAGKETGIRRHGFIKQCRKKIHRAKPHDHEIMGAQGEFVKYSAYAAKGTQTMHSRDNSSRTRFWGSQSFCL